MKYRLPKIFKKISLKKWGTISLVILLPIIGFSAYKQYLKQYQAQKPSISMDYRSPYFQGDKIELSGKVKSNCDCMITASIGNTPIEINEQGKFKYALKAENRTTKTKNASLEEAFSIWSG